MGILQVNSKFVLATCFLIVLGTVDEKVMQTRLVVYHRDTSLEVCTLKIGFLFLIQRNITKYTRMVEAAMGLVEKYYCPV